MLDIDYPRVNPCRKPGPLFDLPPGRLYHGPFSFFNAHFSGRVWVNLYCWVWMELTGRMIQVPYESRPSLAKEAIGKIVRISPFSFTTFPLSTWAMAPHWIQQPQRIDFRISTAIEIDSFELWYYSNVPIASNSTNSLSDMPSNFVQIYSLCSPRQGAGRRGLAGVSDNPNG